MPRPFVFALIKALALSACTAGLPTDAPNPGARPDAMLSGVLCGQAVLTKPRGGVADRMIVTSRGQRAGDGLILDQVIAFGDGRTAARRWSVQPDGPASYRGTLSGDEAVAASGDVRIRVAGDSLSIRYPVAGVPLARMHQILTLRPDGKIDNEGIVSILGVPVRRLSEVIEPQIGMDLQAEAPCSHVVLPETKP